MRNIHEKLMKLLLTIGYVYTVGKKSIYHSPIVKVNHLIAT